jgi:hypothetical protein
MTSAQQNALESAKDGVTFRSGLVEGGKKRLMAGAARRKREPSQLGGLTFLTVLINPQASDFRFKRLPRNPEFRGRT